MSAPILFASMPFGRKSGPLAGGELLIDFDVVWVELFRPAGPEGWTMIRIDEVDEPGLIPTQYLDYLHSAEVVIFDITFANPNVYYELGLRHAVAPNKCILVAQHLTQLPFNLQQYRVLFYDFTNQTSWRRFQQRLRTMIESCARQPEQLLVTDRDKARQMSNTVTNRPNEQRLERQLDRAENLPQLVAIWGQWKEWKLLSTDLLLKLGKRLINERRTDLAVDVLAKAYQEATDEYEVARTYGWYLRKNNQFDEAEEKLLEALRLNSNDIESKGMLGGLYKRQGRYDQSYEQYSSAIKIDPKSVYHLVNLGALEVLLHQDKPDRCRQWYSRVIDLCAPDSTSSEMPLWDRLALAEAYLAIGDLDMSHKEYARVIEEGADLSMLQSAADQLEILKQSGFRVNDCSTTLSNILIPAIVPSVKLSGTSLEEIENGGENRRIVPSLTPIILHISDIHFGYKTGKDGQRSSMHRFKADLYNKPLAEHIINEIKRLHLTENAKQRLVLVISGDIAYEATSEEYKQAGDFIKEVCAKTELPPERVVMVPGNHDVSWTLSKHRPEQRFDEYLQLLYQVYDKTLFYQLYPYIKWDFSIHGERPHPSDILSIHSIPELNLIITGFNSCMFENEEKHYGLIGNKQLNRVSEHLNELDSRIIRIAVLHHHVIPVENRLQMQEGDVTMDISIVRDFGIVEEYFHRMGFDVVLHGHKHTPALRETLLLSSHTEFDTAKRILVCGAGSTSVSYEELPPNSSNHLEILSFQERTRITGKPFVNVEWRELDYTDVAKWETARKWIIMG